MLHAEHKVDAASAQVVRLDSEVPRRDLEAVEDVAGHLVGVDALVHDVTYVHHLELLVTIELHEALLEKDFLVEETLLTSQCFEALWDIVIAISDNNDQEVVLREVLVLRVCLKRIVVVEATSQSSLEFFHFFIVHGDANSERGIGLANSAPGTDLRNHTRVLNLTMPSIGSETSWSELLIKRGLSQHDRLIGMIFGWLPWSFLPQGMRQCVTFDVTISSLVFLSFRTIKFVKRLLKFVNLEKLSLVVVFG